MRNNWHQTAPVGKTAVLPPRLIPVRRAPLFWAAQIYIARKAMRLYRIRYFTQMGSCWLARCCFGLLLSLFTTVGPPCLIYYTGPTCQAAPTSRCSARSSGGGMCWFSCCHRPSRYELTFGYVQSEYRHKQKLRACSRPGTTFQAKQQPAKRLAFFRSVMQIRRVSNAKYELEQSLRQFDFRNAVLTLL